MNYDDVKKSASYFNTLSASYFNSVAPLVYVFKLDKTATKMNPIYNEEIGGRMYCRPFELRSVYKTDPFSFSMADGNPSETEGNLEFIFNFDSMAQTIDSLKTGATSSIKITVKSGNGDWETYKQGNMISLLKIGTTTQYFVNTDTYGTLHDIATYLNSTGIFECTISDDDYSKCIPDYNTTKIIGSIILKTFNLEFRNVSNIVDLGDLIYITGTNSLYEITAAFPVNNAGFKYICWKATGQRTFAYVNYEKLKAYRYGLDIKQVQLPNPQGVG